MGTDIERVTFAGFGRTRDRMMLCTWNSRNCGPAWEDPRLSVVEKLLVAAPKRLAPGQRQKLSWENSSVFVQLQFPGEFLYVVICKHDESVDPPEPYSERIAGSFLKEMMDHVDQNFGKQIGTFDPSKDSSDPFSSGMAQWLTQQAAKFDNPEEYDKLTKLQAKTDAVKHVMKNNINQMLKNTENLNILEEDAEKMAEEAEDYEEDAEEIKDYFWWKDCKVTMLIAFVALVCIALMVWCCYEKCIKKKSSDSSFLVVSETATPMELEAENNYNGRIVSGSSY
mmetsp:Transcript_18014/g.45035  ORF Transcript_18014/g.45035 Transcript_18014/m.45035 type:complete len:282 (+) Transcript_18014:211-1056(+)|eukprot:g5546.t1